MQGTGITWETRQLVGGNTVSTCPVKKIALESIEEETVDGGKNEELPASLDSRCPERKNPDERAGH